ncbi:MAG: bifunctional (p)ppGpp synthetase/guanosine-3',5'-bis(diphosphate) 3'-pyrophosphohydrolase [Chthonomonas sp.]|nr:bifunctional (p)ppGpp synthetase/guanosine-3',5'-bis(diphosphate) 3'-pyrophosphohydrolase [Chthonomonas sp.]
MDLVDAAFRFAARKHLGQVRDGEAALPYIFHPADVVMKLRRIGGITNEVQLAAAALHDVIEECGVKKGELRKRFGEEVTALVLELTRTEPSAAEIADLDKDQIWQLRSIMLLHDIQTKMSPAAWEIKLADRLSNIEEAKLTRSGNKLTRYINQTEQILAIIPESVNPNLWNAIKQQL